MDLSLIEVFLRRLFSFDPNSPLLFTQFYFWAFFAIVYAVFALIGNRRLLRNSFLFFVSLLFYFKTSGLSVLILIFVTCSDFLIARRIASASSPGRKRAWLALSVCIDLLLLCYFKYSYFFADFLHTLTGIELRVTDIFGTLGNALAGRELFRVDSIVLPVGISFFIFQVISYTVDVYRGDVKPVGNILDFGFYVSFFPQLVAGPIVRASEFIPQLYKPFFLGRRQFGVAVFWILNGLAKKIILSDYIAVNFIDRVFENPLLFTGFENLAALFGYSLQVYADFSGYTDIAIGVAMLMGFYLPQNFNSPYKASNPQDFWRRWHMSLSRWLKSYLYIPLGGNRNATFGTYFWIILFAVIAVILSGQWYVSLVFLCIAGVLGLVAWLRPARRKKILANINRFITMLRNVARCVVEFHHLGRAQRSRAHCLPVLEGYAVVAEDALHKRPDSRTRGVLLPRSGACMDSALRLGCGALDGHRGALCLPSLRRAGVPQARVHLGCGADIRLHHLHPAILPQRQQPRPGFGQRGGVAHGPGYGASDRLGVEVGADPADLRRILAGIRARASRDGHPLAPDPLEALVPAQLRPPAPAGDGSCGRRSRLCRLSVHHRRPPGLHIFPVLGGGSAAPLTFYRGKPQTPRRSSRCATLLRKYH